MIYQHKVQYYETDKQGVTHHSNYIRIMEEARIHAMQQIGFGYERMEAEGIYSPVIAVTCQYKRPTTFPDIIDVQLTVAELSTLKAKFAYHMTVAGKLVCTATSLHCFLDKTGRPVALKERFPQFYNTLLQLNEQSSSVPHPE